jgi:hypothetical protein
MKCVDMEHLAVVARIPTGNHGFSDFQCSFTEGEDPIIDGFVRTKSDSVFPSETGPYLTLGCFSAFVGGASGFEVTDLQISWPRFMDFFSGSVKKGSFVNARKIFIEFHRF